MPDPTPNLDLEIVMTEFNSTVALEAHSKRVEDNKDREHVDNSSLPAGAPMFFYCRKCRVHTETLPELFTCRPKTICVPCKVLEDHGLI